MVLVYNRRKKKHFQQSVTQRLQMLLCTGLLGFTKKSLPSGRDARIHQIAGFASAKPALQCMGKQPGCMGKREALPAINQALACNPPVTLLRFADKHLCKHAAILSALFNTNADMRIVRA